MSTKLPTKAEFQQSTDLSIVFSGKRADDQLLQRIDALLDEHRRQDDLRAEAMVLCKLYYVADRWLRLADQGSADVNSRRRGGVHGLYALVVTRLTELTGVPVNLLPNWLRETFGKAMVEHGVTVDLSQHAAYYLSPEERRELRLEFRGGLAYRHVNGDLQLVNTRIIQPQGTRGNPIKEGFSGYVVSEAGDFYSGIHMVASQGQSDGRYHSSYTGGQPVLCAGEIKIEKGALLEINTESGHYRPGPEKLALAVELLGLYGVDLERLRVSGHGITASTAAAFLERSRRLLNLRPARNAGDTPLGRHQQRGVTEYNRLSIERAAAYTKLRDHNKRGGVHSWPQRGRCRDCQALAGFHDAFFEAARAAGGIEHVNPHAPKPAVLARRG